MENAISHILDEWYTLPEDTADLQEEIEAAISGYDELLTGNRTRRKARIRINEMIDEYNERRGMHIYNHIK